MSLYSSNTLIGDIGDELLGLTVALLTAPKITLSQDITSKLVAAVSADYELLFGRNILQ